MRSSFLVRATKQIAKRAARLTLGKLPRPTSRLNGALARDGGKPVRNVRLRPWPKPNDTSFVRWTLHVTPLFRSIYLSGVEGRPHTLAREFARRFAEYSGCRHGLLLAHGTDALRVALAATLNHDGLGYGGEIIVPNLSFIASATAALDRHFGVVLVDVEPDTLLIDPKRAEEAIIPGRTRAIMPVHLFGQPANMTALRAIAERHNLKLIEDAAQAHGAVWETGPVGSLGDAAAFSFQSSKNLNCGEGGLFVTNDDAIFERAYEMHDVGRSRLNPGRWAHHSLGWNMRLNEYAAALLLDRFREFEPEQQRRSRNYNVLCERLREVPCVEPLSTHHGVKRHGAHMLVMRYKPEVCGDIFVDNFVDIIQREGIPVYRGYEATLSQQPVFQRISSKYPELLRTLSTPVADSAVRNILYIPQQVFRGTELDVMDIADAFAKVQRSLAPKAVRKSSVPEIGIAPGLHFEVAKTADTAARPLRFGIIGFGAMGGMHAEILTADSRARLVALTDVRSDVKKAAKKLGARWFGSSDDLITSGDVDAVVIATPHWDHPKLSMAALRAGRHTICEKPLAVSVSEADEVLRVSSQSEKIFAVVFQSRFEPAYRRAKELIDSGEMGRILRASLFEASWRSQAYYSSSPWRGTWKGEGGGVLINQAPHALDRYAWLFGMPTSVMAACDTVLHEIETEDSVSAILRHTNGAQGYIHISTNEVPPTSRLEALCERGRIVIDQGNTTLVRFKESLSQKTLSDSRFFGSVVTETREIPGEISDSPTEMLRLFYDNFFQNVSGEASLPSPGREALNAVELANCMLLSSVQHREVHLPLNRDEFDRFLESKLAVGV